MMLDAASGGAVISKTPREIWELILIMATNSQQFGSKVKSSTICVNEESLKPFDSVVVSKLAIGQEKLDQ